MRAHARRRIHNAENGYTPRATVCLCPSCIAGAPERAAMRRREIDDVRRRFRVADCAERKVEA